MMPMSKASSVVDWLWEVPETTTIASPTPSVFTPVPPALKAPLVLSLDELNVLMGSLSSALIVTRRNYLAPFRGTAGSAPRVTDTSPATGGGVTSSSTYMEFVDIDDINAGRDARTTYMIRRLPRYISVDQLCILMASTGLLADAFDLIYVPIFTGKAHANRGYAFINFKTPQLGALFLSIVKFSPETDLSRQISRCDVVYAHIQSKEDMVANLSRSRSEDGSESLPPGLLLF